MKYKIRQGDCISSIAYRYNLLPETIWDDPANAKLRSLRKDPNVLLPGDEVVVRRKEMKNMPISTGKRHRFQIKGFQEKFAIQFKLGDEPRDNEAYVLNIDGTLAEGQTDENGNVEFLIPPNARTAKILFRDRGDEYTLQLGRMDPITELSGVQGRLDNLGFFYGPIDGKMSEELEQAIRDFQEANDMEPTGDLDEETRNKIEQAHGG